MSGSIVEFYQRNRRWTPIGFFIGGFIFDALMLRRVDELFTILQQAVYLLLSATLIRIEFMETLHGLQSPAWLKRIWKFREDALHFFTGTLLNAYTIFFFKSTSAITSFVFIGLLILILVLNEFGRFGKSKLQIHVGFLVLCLVCFMVTFVPIVVGYIGPIPFLLAIALSIFVFYIYLLWLKPVFGAESNKMRSQIVLPLIFVLLPFTGLYFGGVIPPVPLSVRSIGIYHDVQKIAGGFEVFSSADSFSRWPFGEQKFRARLGESIFCFVRVFSPARFKEELVVHWLRKSPNGKWESMDHIPFPVEGGRASGYRGFTRKTNYQPGQWRVQIEIKDEREIGRLTFEVEVDSDVGERELISHVE